MSCSRLSVHAIVPERQQTMNATVAWSYQLLTSDEQRAFRRFGALPGLFPIDAAAAALAGREPAHAGYRRRAPGGGRSDGQKPSSASRDIGGGDVPAVLHARHRARVRGSRARRIRMSATMPWRGSSAIALDEASLAAEGLVGLDQIEWLDRVREDLESYRAALRWLLDRGRPAEASHIASGLMFFWSIRGHAAEGLRWYEQILNLPSLPPAAESRALARSGAMWYTQGELGRARTALTRAVALAHAAGDLEMLAHASICVRARRTRGGRCRRGARPVCRRHRPVPGARDPVGHRECADRAGGGRARDRRCWTGGTPAR